MRESSMLKCAMGCLLGSMFGLNAFAASKSPISEKDYAQYFTTSSAQTRVINIDGEDFDDQSTDGDKDVPVDPEASHIKVQSTNYIHSVLPIDPNASYLPINPLGTGTILDIANIIAKVWDIVEKNKPVANVDSLGTNALPTAAKENWQLLTGWKPEHFIRFGFKVKNGFGMTPIEFEYEVHLLYGGGVQGKGAYIASARVVPSTVKVLWGYTLNSSVNVASVTNAGTTDSPIAAMTLDVRYSYATPFATEGKSKSFVLQGDGTMKNAKNNAYYFAPTLTDAYE